MVMNLCLARTSVIADKLKRDAQAIQKAKTWLHNVHHTTTEQIANEKLVITINVKLFLSHLSQV